MRCLPPYWYHCNLPQTIGLTSRTSAHTPIQEIKGTVSHVQSSPKFTLHPKERAEQTGLFADVSLLTGAGQGCINLCFHILKKKHTKSLLLATSVNDLFLFLDEVVFIMTQKAHVVTVQLHFRFVFKLLNHIIAYCNKTDLRKTRL